MGGGGGERGCGGWGRLECAQASSVRPARNQADNRDMTMLSRRDARAQGRSRPLTTLRSHPPARLVESRSVTLEVFQNDELKLHPSLAIKQCDRRPAAQPMLDRAKPRHIGQKD